MPQKLPQNEIHISLAVCSERNPAIFRNMVGDGERYKDTSYLLAKLAIAASHNCIHLGYHLP